MLNQNGGTFIEEYRVVRSSPVWGYRDVDAIILPNKKRYRLSSQERDKVCLTGKNIIFVQTKNAHLGM